MVYIYILAGVIGFFILLKQLMLLKLRKMKGKPAPALTGKAGKAVRSNQRSLFYFYSPSCGACRSMTPIVGKMAQDSDHVFKIDISQDFDTARDFGVMATPTTIITKDNIIEDIIIGPQTAKKLNNLI